MSQSVQELHTVHAWLTVKMFIQLAGIAVNAIGFYVVYVYKTSSNQCPILMNLSVAEIFITVNSMTRDIWTAVLCYNNLQMVNDDRGHTAINYTQSSALDIRFPELYDMVFKGVCYAVISELVFTKTLLTIDRLVCIISPIKYKVYLTNSNVVKIIGLTYGLSVLAGILCGIFPSSEFGMSLILGGNAVVFVILAIVTYCIIIQKINESKRIFSHSRVMRTRELVLFKKHYIVPATIVTTFLVFYGLPWFVDEFYIRPHPVRRNNVFLVNIAPTMHNIGAISDPCIYVFLTKHYREILSAKLFVIREIKGKEVPKKFVSKMSRKQVYVVNRKK